MFTIGSKIGLRIKQVSDEGLQFIKREEGCILRPYNDSSGFATIGIGHLIGKRKVNNLDITEYKSFNERDALDLLRKDLKIVEDCMEELIKVDLLFNQYDAIASLVFNIGSQNFKESTLLKDLNNQKYNSVYEDYMLYCKSNNKEVYALKRRRGRERELFLRGTYIQTYCN